MTDEKLDEDVAFNTPMAVVIEAVKATMDFTRAWCERLEEITDQATARVCMLAVHQTAATKVLASVGFDNKQFSEMVRKFQDEFKRQAYEMRAAQKEHDAAPSVSEARH